MPSLLTLLTYCNHVVPSVLWHCWLGGRKGIRPVKNWVVGCWHGYLSGARCRVAHDPADATATHCLLLQQIQIGFTFLVPAHLGSPRKGPLNGCVCVCVLLWSRDTKLPVVGQYLLQCSKAVNKVVLVEAAARVLVNISTRCKHVPCTANCPIQTVNDRRLSVVEQYGWLLPLAEWPTMSPYRCSTAHTGRQPGVDGRVVESWRVSRIYVLAAEDEMIGQWPTTVDRPRLNLPVDTCNQQSLQCIEYKLVRLSFNSLEMTTVKTVLTKKNLLVSVLEGFYCMTLC